MEFLVEEWNSGRVDVSTTVTVCVRVGGTTIPVNVSGGVGVDGAVVV